VALRKAVEALSTAASHTDVTSEALTDLGRAWLLSGDRTAAERALRQAVATFPVTADAFLHLATIAEDTSRIQEARDALVRYATLLGDDKMTVDVATRIAEHSIQLGEPRAAVRWIDRAINETGSMPALVAIKRRASALSTP
jgi:Tfp pilus assembly protein PilF